MQEQADHILSICQQKNIDWNNEGFKQQLALLVNDFINTNFAALIQLLYKLDVSEQKLQKCLADNPGKDAGELIASLIAERQLQKEISRKIFGQQNNIPDEEKW